MTTYSLAYSRDGVELRGAALDLWRYRGHECIIAGPAETGKTMGALHKLDALMWKYAGAQAVIVRKTEKSLASSVLLTYTGKVLIGGAVRVYGGARAERFMYPNGSQVWLAGMDNADKVLSSEFDVVYVNQAEELSEADWETLGTRSTGRAGHMPYALLFGDCNPANREHWIVRRAREGKLMLLKSYHRDNPTLYTADGQITEQGIRSMAVLENLTGARRKRLLEGEWYSPEGVIYDEFDRETHVKERMRREFQRFIVGCDEGYTNPAVALMIGIDNDGRKHVIEEFYQSRVLQAAFVDVCRDLRGRYAPEMFFVDPSAAGLIAEMRAAGLPVFEANNAVNDGIQAVKAALKVQGDGKPRLTIDPSCVNTINEFESYIWAKDKSGQATDKPEKHDDHAMDAGRYALMGVAYAEPATITQSTIDLW